jgi:hypothetical protein
MSDQATTHRGGARERMGLKLVDQSIRQFHSKECARQAHRWSQGARTCERRVRARHGHDAPERAAADRVAAPRARRVQQAVHDPHARAHVRAAAGSNIPGGQSRGARAHAAAAVAWMHQSGGDSGPCGGNEPAADRRVRDARLLGPERVTCGVNGPVRSPTDAGETT